MDKELVAKKRALEEANDKIKFLESKLTDHFK